MSLFRIRRPAVSAIISILFASLAALGQSVDGTITGLVNDPSGAVVPGATVTATNQATQVQYSVATTAQGEYRLEHIPVGTYEVKAAKTGFAALPVSKVAVELNRVATVNLGLALASATTATG